MFDAVPQLNVLSLAIFFPSRMFELLFFFIFVFFFSSGVGSGGFSFLYSFTLQTALTFTKVNEEIFLVRHVKRAKSKKTAPSLLNAA